MTITYNFFLLAYRSSLFETTGQAPSSAVFGPQPTNVRLSVTQPKPIEDYVHKLGEHFSDIHGPVRIKLKFANDRMKIR